MHSQKYYTMKWVRLVIWVLICTITFSCGVNKQKEQLLSVEKLLQKKQNDSALNVLEAINPESIDDQECRALYWLFKTQADYRLYNPVKSDKPLDESIRYFEKNHDEKRLVWAYYYKGSLCDDQNKGDEAIVYLKKAEKIAKEKNMDEVLHHICQAISVVNKKSGEFRFAIDYSLKAINLALKLNIKNNLLSDYMNIAGSYYAIGNEDSADYYYNKLEPLVESIPLEQRSKFYTNIGCTYVGKDNEKAKEYMYKAIEIDQLPNAYLELSEIYKDEGNKKKAYEMLVKALKDAELRLKKSILSSLYEMKYADGEYQEASNYSKWLVEVKDSLSKIRKEQDVRGAQEHFDHETTIQEKNLRLTHLCWAIGGAVILIICLLLLMYQRRRRTQKNLQNIHMEIEGYQHKILQLEQENKNKKQQEKDNGEREAEIRRLKEKIEEMQVLNADILHKGKRLYDHILNNGSTVTWDKKDFQSFMEYYRMLDLTFVQHLENDYDNLSIRYQFFETLFHLGKTEEEVRKIMAIGQSTLRSTRTRIKEKCIR